MTLNSKKCMKIISYKLTHIAELKSDPSPSHHEASSVVFSRFLEIVFAAVYVLEVDYA
jgi:hypothetical protein